MLQLNLLPDVKVEYLKSRRMRGLVMSISLLLIVGSVIAVLLVGSYAYGVQKKQLSDLNKSIQDNVAQLNGIDNLDQILTVQNQLTTLDSLHSAKPAMSRLYVFLPQITPTDVQVSNLDVDFSTSTMHIQGTARTVEAVNQYVDTIKFTTFTTQEDTENAKKAFSSVVLTKIGVTAKGADYTIDFSFDPQIFDINTQGVTLTVPKITTTRSQLTVPDALFKVELPVVAPGGSSN